MGTLYSATPETRRLNTLRRPWNSLRTVQNSVSQSRIADIQQHFIDNSYTSDAAQLDLCQGMNIMASNRGGSYSSNTGSINGSKTKIDKLLFSYVNAFWYS